MTFQSNEQNALFDNGQTRSVNNRSLNDIIRDLMVNGSIEITERDNGIIARAKELLPYGIRIYVHSVTSRNFDDNLVRIRALKDAGFDPVPHVAARRIQARNELRGFLEEAVKNYGVSRVLLIGGDVPDAAGPYNDAISVLRDGVIEESGISEVGFAAYPEGHEHISKVLLTEGLNEKLHLAEGIGLGTYVITQFSFVPSRIVEYCSMLQRDFPETSVYVGIFGPTDSEQLARYARMCGVSTSIRALNDQGFKTAKLVTHTDPDNQLETIARYCTARDTCNIAGIHIFSFGGLIKTGQWMHRMYCN